jgi:hypothetical protein
MQEPELDITREFDYTLGKDDSSKLGIAEG